VGAASAQELGLTISASGFLADNNIELIVVSPLRRALQTAMLLFPPSTHNVPFLITPMHREITDTSGDSAFLCLFKLSTDNFVDEFFCLGYSRL
jgi:broad specificity phosphatase PhoE